ncbi:MAG: HigA family addiction module antitoxin [Gemmatimonadota bacterium]
MTRLPKYRRPTHPGEFLYLDWIEPMGLSVSKAAERLGISRPRLSEIVNGRRGISPDTAARLSKFLGTSADVWMGLQSDYDLWGALYGPDATDVTAIEPAERSAG